MTFMKWAASAAAIAGMALVSGCGGGGSSSGEAQIRLINASVGYPTLSLSVNSNVVGTGIAYGKASDYSNQNVNATVATLSDSGGTNILNPALSTTACSTRCSLVAFGWSGGIGRAFIPENRDLPAAGTSALYLMNLAPDAGSLDFYLTASPAAALTSPVATNVIGGSTAVTLASVGTTSTTYTLTVTGTGKPTDIRLQIPSITLPSQQVATLMVTATPGGTLVNSLLAVQNGSVTDSPSTSARVRVLGTLSGNPTVAATRGTATLLSAQSTPTFGTYQTVGTGTDAATVSLTPAGGSATNYPVNTNFVAGHDYTILAYGTPADPHFNVIEDDNRMALTAGSSTVRLTNGLANASSGLTLKVDFLEQATNVTAGTTSAPAAITVTTTTNTIEVRSPQGIVFTQSLTLQQGGLYEVIMSGDASAPVGELRKLR